MNKYLIIEKNTLSRETLSELIYTIEENSIVYQSEALPQTKALCERFNGADFMILNSTYWDNDYSTQLLLEAKKLAPNSSIVLIVKNTEHLNAERLIKSGANAIITINSNKSEFVAALRSLKLGQSYIGQQVLISNEDNATFNSTKNSPAIKNRFATEIKNRLTPRQCEVLDYMVKGYANKLIAYELGVSEGTIKLHVSSILRALKVTNRTEAAMRAGQHMNLHAH